MTIIDGKEVAAKLRKEIAADVKDWKEQGNRPPHLVAILVGNDGASQTYVGHKERACSEVGFRSTVLRFEADITEEFLLGEIAKLNADPEVDGFIVQLPLPKHISEQRINEAIDFRKDVDGFTPVNTGRMMLGLPAYLPATPDGILELLRDGRQTLRGNRSQQHRRTSHRQSVVAERLGLHGDHLSQPDQRSGLGGSYGRYCDCRFGESRIRDGRYD